jgi:DMSO/TMAO reductase YedYZ molybdopterin-dependent catalytic subunit
MIRATLEACTRRDFLQTSAALSTALMVGGQGGRAGGQAAPLRLIPRTENPLNLETPLAALDRFVTPNDLFYVRNHFPAPTVDANTWRLRVEGAVERALTLTLDEIRRLESRTVPATLECAGNSRGSLTPNVRGLQWGNGAVSNAEWTGVPLIDILNRAGIRPDAVDIVLEGADRGEIAAEPRSPGVIHYARSVPIAKARQRDVLLAHRMNNAELPANHGFPLRAVVPGWYGMASIKWLTKITVVDRPFNGYFQSLDYSVFERRQGLVTVTPLSEMQVKALIAMPAAMERIAPNTACRVHGAAWTGASEISRVEVSSDQGRTWSAARLLEKPRAHCWRLWEFPWRSPAQAGRVSLMARATDARGHTQPMQRDADRRNYMINHVLPVEVDVR